MKKIVVFFLLLSFQTQAQLGKSMFTKDPIINLENFDIQTNRLLTKLVTESNETLE